MEAALPIDSTRDIARYSQFVKSGAPGMHAYVVLLGLEYFDLPSVLKAVEKGFPWKAFERLTQNLGLPSEQVAEMVGIPRRTLARRKLEKRFDSDESDRLLRAARVFARTLRLFDGDRDAAVEWLTTLEIALGAAPASLMNTDVGAREVERIIGALEHGIFL
jgi:putative toxin-antitoxin system antitoxin component (TIGR02293 family)